MRRVPDRWHGLAAGLTVLFAALPCLGEYDKSRYMSPDEVKPGMKGVGRTVMRGSKIETFKFEVVGVMRNAYYAGQDVILVRCSGLNLEHSGIIAGMSGSPCYVQDENGRERMIGAVAYGWSFNKDPVCGVQPITQMLPISEIRMPTSMPAPQTVASSGGGTGLPLGELIARAWRHPIDQASRFSIFNDDIARLGRPETAPTLLGGLRPLGMPVMVSSVNPHTLRLLQRGLERYGMHVVSSGGGSAHTGEHPSMEPGSVLCIPFMTGDLNMEGLGTCTEVLGDRILGFGHSMFGEGSVELPLATGSVHTVISSLARSEKLGAMCEVVGTLYGDESSGIFGVRGRAPDLVPVEVVIRDLRGERKYHYKIVQEQSFSPMLLGAAITESIYAHSDPPKEHTIRYAVETEFKDLGTFRTTNVTSQMGPGGAVSDAAVPTIALMNSPFGKAKLARARVEVSIEPGARLAQMEEARILKTTVKPGETVRARVRWMHQHRTPQYTFSDFELKVPADLPDGQYDLSIGSAASRLAAMRAERPHLFRADSLPEMLANFNLMGGLQDNRVYLTLGLPRGGLAVDNVEMPALPSFRQQILVSSKRTDINRFTESLVAQHEMDFVVSGSRSFKITVSRRADQ